MGEVSVELPKFVVRGRAERADRDHQAQQEDHRGLRGEQTRQMMYSSVLYKALYTVHRICTRNFLVLFSIENYR